SGLAGPTRASRTAQTGPGQALASPTPAGPLARWPAGPLVLWPAGPLARWPAGPLVLWPAEPLARPAENRPAEPRRRTRLFALARFFDHTRLCTAGPATPQAVWVALAESWTATASLARSRARRSSELVSNTWGRWCNESRTWTRQWRRAHQLTHTTTTAATTAPIPIDHRSPHPSATQPTSGAPNGLPAN